MESLTERAENTGEGECRAYFCFLLSPHKTVLEGRARKMLGHLLVTCLESGVHPYFSRTPQQASCLGASAGDQLQPWASSQNCPLHSLFFLFPFQSSCFL